MLGAIVRRWRPSVFAGFMGAVASEFWFLAFALTSVANVRTLALVEVIFAQAISYFVFRQKTSPREAFGMSMIVAGVALLLSCSSDISGADAAAAIAGGSRKISSRCLATRSLIAEPERCIVSTLLGRHLVGNRFGEARPGLGARPPGLNARPLRRSRCPAG